MDPRRVAAIAVVGLTACAPMTSRQDASAFDDRAQGRDVSAATDTALPRSDGGTFTPDADPNLFDSGVTGPTTPQNPGPGYSVDSAHPHALTQRGDAADPPLRLRCKPGYVAVGLGGRAGSWIDAVTLRCARLTVTGTITGTVETLTLSGSTGGEPFTDSCAANAALVRLRGAIGTATPSGGTPYHWIGRLGGGCAQAQSWVNSGKAGADLPLHGLLSDGTSFSDVCPVGSVIVGLDLNAQSAAVFGIKAYCARVYFTPA